MKPYIFFHMLVVICTAASAQQNINDSLKNEMLFKQLVRAKGKLLYELNAVRKTNDRDSLKRHFQYITCLCHSTMLAIDDKPSFGNRLENALVSSFDNYGCGGISFPGKDLNPNYIYDIVLKLGRLASGYEYQRDMLVIRHAVLTVESDLRKAIITY